MLRQLRNLLKDQRGDQFTELGLILGLIVIVAIGALSGLGGRIVQALQSASAAI